MSTVLIKLEDADLKAGLQHHVQTGYKLRCDVDLQDFPALCAADRDINGVVIESCLVTTDDIQALRAAVGDDLFPIFLLESPGAKEDPEKWVDAGAFDLVQMGTPPILVSRRIGTAIRLYASKRRLQGVTVDPLTGLFNINAFYQKAAEMIYSQPEADYMLIVSDIENFKLINERYGESRGDELLRYVGGWLSFIKDENSLYARYGGDRFVSLLRYPKDGPEPDPEQIDRSVQLMYDDAPVEHFEVKFGIYDKLDKTLPVSIMCDRALMALKTIKHHYGKTLAYYSAQLQLRFNREQRILDSMEQAIDEGQFMVYYQPKHDLKSGQVIGAEALVRWEHPNYGFLPPNEFIPLFESSGFISRLDTFVWNRVCADMKQLLDEGRPVVPVSVNVSRRDFLRTGFLQTLQEPVGRLGLDPQLFHLEVTESIFMEDAQLLSPILREVRSLGYRIELDDFGSGFSSLGILSKLPFDVIKLDIALIRNMEAQPAIVDSVTHLMHTLGYSVTAEGVETETHLALLRRMGCDTVQGYYYSRPLTLSGFCDYLQQCAENG